MQHELQNLTKTQQENLISRIKNFKLKLATFTKLRKKNSDCFW